MPAGLHCAMLVMFDVMFGYTLNIFRVCTGPRNPGIYWKMKSVLEFGFVSLNIQKKSILVGTKIERLNLVTVYKSYGSDFCHCKLGIQAYTTYMYIHRV